MNYFTATIPLPLAEKLKEKGMPILISRETFSRIGKFPYEHIPMFCEVFDWLMSRDYYISIDKYYDQSLEAFVYVYSVQSNVGRFESDVFMDWHEAAEKAIEKALTLI